jgi:Uma2 family endonuclease
MASEPRQRLTIQDYLTLERQSETRSDYLDGEMFAMTGASRQHNRIVLNLAFSLDSQLGEKGCEVFASEMRVRTPTNLFTYPDVAVACGEVRYEDSEIDTLLNPIVVIEVLSKSTEAYDRVTKLAHYKTIPSLAEILLIAQNQPHVEHWMRQPDDRWLVEERNEVGQTLDLPSIGCTLAMAEIYRRVIG